MITAYLDHGKSGWSLVGPSGLTNADKPFSNFLVSNFYATVPKAGRRPALQTDSIWQIEYHGRPGRIKKSIAVGTPNADRVSCSGGVMSTVVPRLHNHGLGPFVCLKS